MRRVARFIVWVFFLELLWGMYVGTTQSTELVAGLAVSVVVAIFVEVLRARGVLGFRLDARALGRARTIPGHVVLDFFLVFWILLKALAQGRRVRGAWIEAPYEAPPGPRGRFTRALTVALENGTANGLVVDLADGRALLHSLDPRVKTGKEVM